MGSTTKIEKPEDSSASSGLDQSIEDALNSSSSADGAEIYDLRVSADNISILLDCSDPHGDLESLVNRIIGDFKKMELPEYPSPEILSEILKKSCEPGECLVSFTIMKGWEATSSQDGHLDWERDFFSENIAHEDEDEVHDFWDKNDQQSVVENELLARIHHPVPGEIGLDVFSQEIPVSKPSSVKIRSGKGVRQIDEGICVAYYADWAGRIRFQDNTLVIDDVYIIKGDVSMETGNIQHTGTVHVEGDVQTGATIETEGDILVKGMMDPCFVKCGGSLSVQGGIVGQDDFLIEVAGDVKAMYIGAAVIICGGDVLVTNEISHANIKAHGKVLVPTGRIAGGEIVARAGIQMAEAGGSGATSTLLVVGGDFTAEARIAEHEERITKLEEAQDKIEDALTKAGMAGDGASVDSEQIGQLSAKNRLIGEAIIKEYSAIKVEKQKSKASNGEEVVMSREVWSGTKIQIGEASMVVRSSIEKPRISRLINGKVRLLPLGKKNMPKD